MRRGQRASTRARRSRCCGSRSRPGPPAPASRRRPTGARGAPADWCAGGCTGQPGWRRGGSPPRARTSVLPAGSSRSSRARRGKGRGPFRCRHGRAGRAGSPIRACHDHVGDARPGGDERGQNQEYPTAAPSWRRPTSRWRPSRPRLQGPSEGADRGLDAVPGRRYPGRGGPGLSRAGGQRPPMAERGAMAGEGRGFVAPHRHVSEPGHRRGGARVRPAGRRAARRARSPARGVTG
jgi:hypothetical protein